MVAVKYIFEEKKQFYLVRTTRRKPFLDKKKLYSEVTSQTSMSYQNFKFLEDFSNDYESHHVSLKILYNIHFNIFETQEIQFTNPVGYLAI